MNAGRETAVIDVTTESKEVSSVSAVSALLPSPDLEDNPLTVADSMVQSQSVESFSTLHEIENLSELEMEENGDLCVRVDDPQKHLDTLETYITFRITTKVARVEFPENHYIVRRRYNDFLWLRQKLVEAKPAYIVAPLPGKHTWIGHLDRYSKDFVLARMKALNVFISRIVQHPMLSCNEHVRVFLIAKHPEFYLHRRSRSNSISKVPSTSNFLVTNYALKTKMVEFEKNKNYVKALMDKLLMIEKISNRINKERLDYVQELNSFYPALNMWAIFEPSVSSLLQRMCKAVEKTSQAHSRLCSQNPTLLSVPIREFLVYVDVVKEVLNRRDAIQFLYEASSEELAKKRNEKDELLLSNQQGGTAAGGHFSLLWKQTADQKLEKLGASIPQLVKQNEIYLDQMECANEALRSDLNRWHAEKQAYVKKMLLNFAQKQVECYEKVVAAWEIVNNDCI